MTTLRKLLVLTGIFAVVASPAAMAGGMHLSVVTAGVYGAPGLTNYSTPFNAKKLGYPGGGALLEFGFGKNMGLELGAIYATRGFSDGGGNSITNSYVMSSGLVRFALGNMFSLGAGAYYTRGIGSIKGSDGSTTDYDTVGLKKADYGLVASAGLDFPLSHSVGLLVDGRVSYGLANNATDALTTLDPTIKVTQRDIMGLVGLRFAMGGSK